MPSVKNVALVVGASRGIGRQIAIDLAKNGYAGMPPPPQGIEMSNFNQQFSRRGCKNHLQCIRNYAIPPRSELLSVNHQHRRAGDPGIRRRCIRSPRGCSRCNTDRESSERDRSHLWEAGCPGVQFRGYLVVVGREYTDEALPVDAES